ncbi:hypothetical protein ABXV18_27195 [Vibrio owensii]|uniref:hypothetical protein n=1 Tax=Vibrio owensii TaxID=696485 RepID=UPI0033970FAC
MGRPNFTNAEWIAKAKNVHPGGGYDYSETSYTKAKGPVRIICRRHGPFEQRADSHLKGMGCKECGREAVSQKNRGRAFLFPLRSEIDKLVDSVFR